MTLRSLKVKKVCLLLCQAGRPLMGNTEILPIPSILQPVREYRILFWKNMNKYSRKNHLKNLWNKIMKKRRGCPKSPIRLEGHPLLCQTPSGRIFVFQKISRCFAPSKGIAADTYQIPARPFREFFFA